MKNTILKTIGSAALAILMMAAFAQIPASAQSVAAEGKLLQPTKNTQGFVGTWDVQVTITNCQTGAPIISFPSLTSFLSGGTVIDSTSRMPQSLKTPGHGVWTHLTGQRYRFKFKSFSFDASGNFTGWTIITHEADLDTGADAYTSAGTSEIYNSSGVLITTGCSTTTATRFE
jgi:hypothetical protein